MTKDNGITRRSVLRNGVATAGLAAVGVGSFSGTALASACPRTPGFWANHDWCEVLTSGSKEKNIIGSITCKEDGSAEGTYTLKGVEKDMSGWQSFLVSPIRGDKAKIMAKQLLAAKLNAFRRPGGDRDDECFNKPIDMSEYGLDEVTTVDDVVTRGSAWLAGSSFDSSERQKDWVVDDVYNADGPVDGEPLKNILDAFNNGQLNLDCGCTGDSDSDSRKGEGQGKGEGKEQE